MVYTEPVEAAPIDQLQSLRELVADMNAGQVDLLVILGGNPVYTAPADLDVRRRACGKVPLRVHLGLHDDETSQLCHWHVPEAHFLEAWSDARGIDGTVSIVQPLIAPLYGGRSAHELLAALNGERRQGRVRHRPRALDRRTSASRSSTCRGAAAERRDARHPPSKRPGAAGCTTASCRARRSRRAASTAEGRCRHQPPAANAAGLEIVFRHDPSVLDGRFANNGWLQELPKPITKLTWDNAVLVSPATAARLERRRRLRDAAAASTARSSATSSSSGYRGRTVAAPIFVVPGHPDDCVTVHLGYGRRARRTRRRRRRLQRLRHPDVRRAVVRRRRSRS